MSIDHQRKEMLKRIQQNRREEREDKERYRREQAIIAFYD